MIDATEGSERSSKDYRTPPVLNLELNTADENLHRAYERIRRAAPVCQLTKEGLYYIGRYDDVR